jgi:hypothetical protein
LQSRIPLKPSKQSGTFVPLLAFVGPFTRTNTYKSVSISNLLSFRRFENLKKDMEGAPLRTTQDFGKGAPAFIRKVEDRCFV